MIIIGISGKKKSGKTTIANHIKSLYPNRVYDVAFADALKDEVCNAMHITRGYMEQHKDNFRLILQGWGTNYRRALSGDDYWIKRMANKLMELPNDCIVVVPDVRFYNEADLIKDIGGQLWKVERLEPDIDDHHPSECELDSYARWDQEIYNHTTVQELQSSVTSILKTQNIK